MYICRLRLFFYIFKGVLLSIQNALKKGDRNVENCWSAMKCSRVVHDPTGNVRKAMDQLSLRLRTLTTTNDAKNAKNGKNDKDVLESEKKKKKKSKKKKKKKENEENADTTITKNQSEQSILIYLTSECLHAQLALRIGDVINDTDAWYESELPSIVGK